MSCYQEPTLEYQVQQSFIATAARGAGQEQSWPLLCPLCSAPLTDSTLWIFLGLIPLPCSGWVRPNPWINLPGARIHVEQLSLTIGTVSVATCPQQATSPQVCLFRLCSFLSVLAELCVILFIVCVSIDRIHQLLAPCHCRSSWHICCVRNTPLFPRGRLGVHWWCLSFLNPSITDLQLKTSVELFSFIWLVLCSLLALLMWSSRVVGRSW